MKSFFRLPETFTTILNGDENAKSAVIRSLSKFEPWLIDSGKPFFKGYTEHGVGHINSVMQISEWVISEKAAKILTPADIMVLSLAILSHDAAMAFTEDSFRTLIKDEKVFLPELDDKSWTELWEDYIGEVSRFDSRKLLKITGSNDPYNIKNFEINNIKERDRYVIGEFLRRHHGRLAHEVAASGVPGPGVERIELQMVEKDIADLIGLIARSHTTPIRSLFQYLQSNYNIQFCQDIHITFLMTILRVSDYLDMRSDRANKELLKVNSLKSPISRQEWQLHHSIRDIRFTHPDPEAIEIDAIPKDITSFVKLGELLLDLQRELDECWAVLGEVYGRYQREKWDQLGLRIRRVRSTMENLRSLRKKLSFIPVKASFDAAGVDLLKLLIHPLYGDEPGIGIRELIQNSVDACKEMHDMKNSDTKLAKKFAEVSVVHVDFYGENKTIVVKDTGVGMTLDTVLNYFLRAGATFRNSETWKKYHSNEDGKSNILRGGRFGVGVLAAFLLGERIEIATKHFNEQTGISFKANLDDEQIEITECDCDFGTVITIHTDEKTWERLSPSTYELIESGSILKYWPEVDWYCSDDPSVEISYHNKNKDYLFKQEYTLPNVSATLPEGWYRIKTKEYDDVQWTFYRKSPRLTCNGIFVVDTWNYNRKYLNSRWWENSITILRPHISVYDSQGIFPLNLQRNDISTQELAFDLELANAIAKDYLAYVLVNAPCELSVDDIKTKFTKIKNYAGVEFFDSSYWFPMAITDDGTHIIEKDLSKRIKRSVIWCVPRFDKISDKMFLALEKTRGLIICNYNINYEPDLYRWIRMGLNVSYAPGNIKWICCSKSRMLISKTDYQKAMLPRKINKLLLSSMKIEAEVSDYYVVSNNIEDNTGLEDFITTATTCGMSDQFIPLIEWRISEELTTSINEVSPILSQMNELGIKDAIPFHSKERKQKFKRAYRTLSRNMQYFKEDKERIGED